MKSLAHRAHWLIAHEPPKHYKPLAYWLTWLTPSDPYEPPEPLLGGLVNTMCKVVLSMLIHNNVSNLLLLIIILD